MRKLLIVVCLITGAQTPRPAFEAASVKANTGSNGIVRIATFPTRLSAVNATLHMLVRYGFNVPDYRLSGGPSWMDSDRFDIEGAAGRSADFDEIRAMTRSVLEDRFMLRSHLEKREQPIFVLTVSRRDGKLGEQIAPSGNECKPITAPKGAPPPPPPPGGAASGGPRCPSLLSPFGISGRKMPMSLLVSTLSNSLNRHIVDQTNLTGTFDLDVHWLPDQLPNNAGAFAPPLPIDTSWPPLLTALQEQLGLKLESARGPVDVLVIDSAEKPSSD